MKSSSRSSKSTSVRSFIWGFRSAALRSIHAIAPDRAARLAARWFVTPERRRLPAPRIDGVLAPDPGMPLVLGDAGRRLAARSWGSGPLVLLVHGWNGRGGQMAALARAIAARGHRAVAFDHPAHGESSGRHVTIPDMASAIELVSEQLGGAHAVVAHSLGAVAATVAMSRGLSPARAVFLAPPVRPDDWLLRFGRALGLPESSNGDLVRAIEERAGVPVAAIRPLELAPALDTELLIVHDRDDREVPIVHGEALAKAWPGAQLVTTSGLGHNRLLSSPETVALVARFIGEALVTPEVRVPLHGVRDPHLAAFVERVTIA